MTDLGNRMKKYEQKFYLPENLPVIIRIDGRAFHTLLRGMEKPFDNRFVAIMNEVGIALCNEIQNCRMAYLQSDEISFLLYQNRDAQPWFSNEIQKIASITASIASSVFTDSYSAMGIDRKNAMSIAFDSRAFVLPPNEVVNYFIWRQLDWERNSIQMLSRAHYSHNELKNVNTTGMLELLLEKDVDWNELPQYLKMGRTVVKIKTREPLDDSENSETYERTRWSVNDHLKKFTEDREFIESKMEPDFAIDLGTVTTKVFIKV